MVKSSSSPVIYIKLITVYSNSLKKAVLGKRLMTRSGKLLFYCITNQNILKDLNWKYHQLINYRFLGKFFIWCLQYIITNKKRNSQHLSWHVSATALGNLHICESCINAEGFYSFIETFWSLLSITLITQIILTSRCILINSFN